MRAVQGIGNLILVVMAAASLVMMIAAYVVDIMVNGNLYYYGLHFNLAWFTPFKNVIGLIYAMAWVNIILALGFEVYRIRTIHKDKLKEPDE
jgi:hypothetical protein